METSADTLNKKAFDLFIEARKSIDSYRRSHDIPSLEYANSRLQEALRIDPTYVRARYYNGIVLDMVGRAKDAIDEFENVLHASPPFIDEVHYNLGVAYYHRYSQKYLAKAVEHFSKVIDGSKGGSALELLARACLAQTYAMMMIPSSFEEVDRPLINTRFDLCATEFNKVSRHLLWARMFGSPKVDQRTIKEIRWASHNARGMSFMYFSDYFGAKADRIKNLDKALSDLQMADASSPKNWANYCDLGSAHMRIGYWLGKENGRAQEHFRSALDYLSEVVNSLRPNYGFALYEIGRVYRLMGNFEESIEFFDKALQVEGDYRDVSDQRINQERSLAQERSFAYPWKGTDGVS